MARREPSRGEAAAWKQLRALRQQGFAFRREHEVGPYRADFVCLRRRVIVEVDGGVHALPGRAEHDARRDAWLKAEGYVVLRFTDTTILSEARWIGDVMRALQAQAEASYRWKTAERTPSLEGRGQGEGESVERGGFRTRASEIDRAGSEAHLTLPPAPFPFREGG